MDKGKLNGAPNLVDEYFISETEWDINHKKVGSETAKELGKILNNIMEFQDYMKDPLTETVPALLLAQAANPLYDEVQLQS